MEFALTVETGFSGIEGGGEVGGQVFVGSGEGVEGAD